MPSSLEIVVVGTGNKTERLRSEVLQSMRQRGIAVEVQDTVGLQTRKSYLVQARLARHANSDVSIAAQCLCHFQLPVP